MSAGRGQKPVQRGGKASARGRLSGSGEALGLWVRPASPR